MSDRYGHNDHDNAILVYDLTQGNLRFDEITNSWYEWKSGAWSEPIKPIDHIVAAAHYRMAQAGSLPADKWQAEAKWANQSKNIYHITSTQAVMEQLSQFAFPKRNKNPYIFATKNAAIDLTTGEAHTPTRDEGLILRSNVEYDPEAKCPTWLAYLESSHPNLDVQHYLARAVGYTLTGSMREQAFFYLLGLPETGKSTFMHVLRSLMGTYAADTNFSTFEEKYGNGIPNDLAPLRDKRLVIAGEPSKRSRWNDQVIKSITGEDPITARFLHKEFFTYLPQFKVWIMANWEIGTNDASEAFFRRTKVVKFENTFRNSSRKDPHLKEKLTAELPGILNWAIAGAKSWLETGLREPALVAAAIQDYKESEATNTKGGLGMFLDDYIIPDFDSELSPPEFYRLYKDWTRGIGMSDKEALSLIEFGRQLSTLGYTVSRTATKRFYRAKYQPRIRI